MSTEELRMILEAVGQLGGEGKAAFIAWAALAYLPGVLGWMFTISEIAWVVLRVVCQCLGPTRPTLSRIQVARDALRELYLYGEDTEHSSDIRDMYWRLNAICKENHNERE